MHHPRSRVVCKKNTPATLISAAAFLAIALVTLALPATAETSAAAIELHNLSGEFLPRVDSYSEQALNRYFNRYSSTRFVSRTAVSELLLRRRDRVVLFPSDPVLTADFGRDLGVDYVVTGTILDYENNGSTHRMMVELMIIGVDERDYILRKVYDGDYRDTSGYKKHRQILDQIIENMAVDFESYIGKAEEARLQRAEAARLRAEQLRLAQERAEAERRAAREAAARAAAEAKAAAESLRKTAEALQAGTESKARLLEAEAKLAERRLAEEILRAKQKELIKEPIADDASWVVVRVHEVRLLKDNWGRAEGTSDAEFQMVILAPQTSGNASTYVFPGNGAVPLGVGDRLPIDDAGFSLKMSPKDGDVTLRFCGIDQDAQGEAVSLSIDSVLALIADKASDIARSKGLGSGRARLFGVAIGAFGGVLSRFIQKNDIIGQAEVVINHRGGPFADGHLHVVRSPDETIEFVFDVQVAKQT